MPFIRPSVACRPSEFSSFSFFSCRWQESTRGYPKWYSWGVLDNNLLEFTSSLPWMTTSLLLWLMRHYDQGLLF
ncbi:uncharacterized protein BDW47DRAFT_106759 [Aspergillus candidus]|uniref:Uncharacterized protein n=1 Tax=Aspergillus candidus TaxID=41067 RepID=A0A2I2FA58_ASPCN|nr:hypothetical protein BDW47DRAFT_106759 [Aspergillus candidus]PLB37507.1 hypothetical protein BDW47DRAFT_106759 [Aspergillus candidus]